MRQQYKCKCKLFTLTQYLHTIYMAIDIYMHNIGLDLPHETFTNPLPLKFDPINVFHHHQ